MSRRLPRLTSASSALGLALVFTLTPAVAHAQDAKDAKAAEELFQLGKSAMAKGDVAKACTYFQGSLNADFALGTLLNLAMCQEQAGKTASAWSSYRTLEDRARQANPPQAERAKYAHDKAEALRPKLARVAISLSSEAKATSGVVVKIDGTTAPPELFEAGVPVDTGKRVVTATAPDHEEWMQTVSVDADKQRVDVKVPALKAMPKAPPPAPEATKPVEPVKVAATEPKSDYRTVGYVVGGVGVAALATGGIFGLLALGKSSDAECPGCATGSNELATAKSAYDSANTMGWVSNIALVAGVVGVGVGTVLVLTSGSGAEKKTARLMVSPNGAAIGGAW